MKYASDPKNNFFRHLSRYEITKLRETYQKIEDAIKDLKDKQKVVIVIFSDSDEMDEEAEKIEFIDNLEMK